MESKGEILSYLNYFFLIFILQVITELHTFQEVMGISTRFLFRDTIGNMTKNEVLMCLFFLKNILLIYLF